MGLWIEDICHISRCFTQLTRNWSWTVKIWANILYDLFSSFYVKTFGALKFFFSVKLQGYEKARARRGISSARSEGTPQSAACIGWHPSSPHSHLPTTGENRFQPAFGLAEKQAVEWRTTWAKVPTQFSRQILKVGQICFISISAYLCLVKWERIDFYSFLVRI